VTWTVAELLPAEALTIQKQGKFQWSGAAVSPYKIFHMGGNAAEWVGDWYDPAYYCQSPMVDPKGPQTGTIHVYRGGYYLSPAAELSTTLAIAIFTAATLSRYALKSKNAASAADPIA